MVKQANNLILATNALAMDEACYSLEERNEQAPDGRGWRRYQLIAVVRNGDQIAQMRRDLGPAKRFKTEQFFIPGGVKDDRGRIEIVETVGRLMDIADNLRDSGVTRAPERKRPHLIDEYREQPERRRLWRKRRSMVGPLVRVQRG